MANIVKKKVCIVIGGHITCCPRMMKMAIALSDAGSKVTIVSPVYSDSVRAADLRFLNDSRWAGCPVEYFKKRHPFRYYYTAARIHTSRRMIGVLGPSRFSLVRLGRGYTRVFDELLKVAVKSKADLYLGGTAGGLAVAARASELTGKPFALDLEDYHSDEQDPSPDADLSHAIIREIETRILKKASFLTAGSDAISREYASQYGVACHTINNVFELPSTDPGFEASENGVLRLVWLSQTVGPGRGIECAVKALLKSGVVAELTLRGTADEEYLRSLRALLPKDSGRVRIKHIDKDMTKTVVELCQGYDVGLALEQGHVLNRKLCLCNKPFTYMLAGLAVAFTDTPGQRNLAIDLGIGGFLFPVDDEDALAVGLKAWASNKQALIAAKRASWEAAVRRWNWNNSEERGKAIRLVQEALS